MTLHGLDRQVAAFEAALSGGRLHHAWLLAGSKGVGKARFAEAAVRLLLPGEQSRKLLEAGSHPDFRRLERLPNEKTGNLARNITVDQVRSLRALFANATALGGRRAVVVDSIDDMERGAANALLKNLEEPPAGTVFLLVSHAPGRLLATIRSRCRTLMFGGLDDQAIDAILCEQLPELEAAERSVLVAGARGSAAAAIGHVGLDIAGLDAALDELARIGDRTNALRAALAQSLALKAAAPRYEAFLDRVPAFIAQAARTRTGVALDRALDHWADARRLAGIAVPQSLTPESVVFEIAGHVAALAPEPGNAKA